MIMTESDTGWVEALVPVCILYIYLVFSYELRLFLPVTDTVKYRKSQFYATNHKSHQNVMSLTGNIKECGSIFARIRCGILFF